MGIKKTAAGSKRLDSILALKRFISQQQRALRKAEAALAEGHQNCGGTEDNIFSVPLKSVRAALKEMSR